MRAVGRARVALALTSLALSGCVTPSERIDRLASRAGFARTLVATNAFEHVVYEKRTDQGGAWIVFLEGDGRPSRDGSRISPDPTTLEPVALRLAASTPGNVIYLSRPCYGVSTKDPHCDPEFWTSARYSPAVVSSLRSAIESRVLGLHGATDVWLVGYSGGGTLAVLVAKDLQHVSRVITIAGNLSVTQWANYHGHEPLTGSLDPMLEAALRSNVEQVHLAGAGDTNILPEFVRSYVQRQSGGRLIEIPGFNHQCCWVQEWETIWKRVETPSQTGR
jgi:pimeloyl-ACP methyl ester carboxylesterase